MCASHRPAAPDVPLEVWRELLDASLALRAAAPWRWMIDSDRFALIDEAGRPWFPAVLGAAGQIFGVALYRGENGLRYLLETADTLAEDPRAALFAQDALLLDWGAKKLLAPEDLATLRALGYAPRPREKNAWPSYRSHTPGLYPWFLDADEARSLARCTRALVACAELALHTPNFFAPSEEDGAVLPTVEIATALAGPLRREQIDWRTWQLAPLEPPPVPAVPPEWRALAAKPKSRDAVVEFDIFHLASPTSDGERPYFPRVALVADGDSGYLYAMQMADPARDWGELVVATWSQAFGSLQNRPKTIAIRRPDWEPALQPLAAQLGIGLEIRYELPFIDEARDSMEQFAGR